MTASAVAKTLPKPNPFLAPAAENVDRQSPVDPEEVIARLGRRRSIHTVQLGFCIAGADVDATTITAALLDAPSAFWCLPGSLAANLDHDLAVWTPDPAHWAGGRWLFEELKNR